MQREQRTVPVEAHDALDKPVARGSEGGAHVDLPHFTIEISRMIARLEAPEDGGRRLGSAGRRGRVSGTLAVASKKKKSEGTCSSDKRQLHTTAVAQPIAMGIRMIETEPYGHSTQSDGALEKRASIVSPVAYGDCPGRRPPPWFLRR